MTATTDPDYIGTHRAVPKPKHRRRYGIRARWTDGANGYKGRHRRPGRTFAFADLDCPICVSMGITEPAS